MPVWNPNAIDYSAGLDVVDYKGVLILRARKIGCWVMTVEESRACLEKRGWVYNDK
jgi:hypothetical protein